MNDLKFAFRQLLKKPGFTAVVILTLALGIGVTTSVFSALNAVLLRSLPYRKPEELVWIFASNPKMGYPRLPVNWASGLFSEWQQENQAFAEVGRFKAKEFLLQESERSEPVNGMRASANIFDVLGIQPLLGRTFLPEENELGRHRVVLLGYELWQRRFAGARDIVGKAIALIDTEQSDRDGAPHDTLAVQRYTVVGILPRRFQFPIGAIPEGASYIGRNADIWEPESLTTREKQARSVLDVMIGRLRPGISLKQAVLETQTLFERIRAEAEHQPTQTGSGYRIDLLPLKQQVAGTAGRALLLLLGASAFVLLIGCANVANLLLARGTARQKEFAIRAALGASRFPILRQLMAENLILALAAGILGTMAGWWMVHFLPRFASNLPRANEVALDGRVLGFAFLLSGFAVVAFGFAPALQLATARLNDVLKKSATALSGGRAGQRARNGLVVSEIALSLVLLVGAGLLINSFVRLLNVDPGYKPERVLALHLSFRHPKFTNDATFAFVQPLLERLRSLPGVQSAAITSWVPVEGGRDRFEAGVGIQGRISPVVVKMSFLTPNYFDAMSIPILKGRDFTWQDFAPGAPPVKIVSESFVRKYLPNEEPIGKRVDALGPPAEIVGVVKDTLEAGLDAKYEPHLYHSGVLRSGAILLRASADASNLRAAVENEVLALDKDQPPLTAKTLQEILSDSVAERRFQMMFLAIFAGAALLLATVGIYAVVSYGATQRIHEMGIRIALGATRADITTLLVQGGMKLALFGLVTGLIAALTLTRLINNVLFEIKSTDPYTFSIVALLLLGSALLACWLPARRAARIDPMEALRCE